MRSAEAWRGSDASTLASARSVGGGGRGINRQQANGAAI